MDWMNLPPLASLRAFSAFAERRNVTQAGQALNVSHAAISQQLRALESHLGISLLDRSGKSLTLTADGEHLARALQLGFGAIGAAIDDLTRSGADRPVHVSLTSTFAASWLMPRLPAFRCNHPEVSLILEPSPDVVELRPGGVDLAIRYGAGGWAGVQSQMLLQTPMVIVAAPELLGGKTDWSPADLAHLPWLEEIGTTEASTWLAGRGASMDPAAGRISLPGNLVLDGLRAGQGVTITVRHFVQQDILSGRLVELYAEPDTRGYHIVTGQGALRPTVRTFVGWLKRQASEN
ncbi:LysR family transcriptional regulator [Ruegeria sp. 2205SS24-7]|uniref:LysR family transcriptional regulator n=1 Tax=Ruegeria discodermiae TaxID=3064389 RepID=UPI0027411635|nr:LysR family transcriptional regulator [Ruegeria sp. 2205SS24-7]MDP5219630.1 LysR family transcriptional regulator [Ruegeria sp. 2205SS24-7]